MTSNDKYSRHFPKQNHNFGSPNWCDELFFPIGNAGIHRMEYCKGKLGERIASAL